MKTLSIAWKDMQILFKDYGTLLYLFLLPMVFVLMFSLLSSGAQREASAADRLIELPVVNLDPGGEAAQTFIDNLNQAGGIQTVLYEEAEARALLEGKEINALLTIPADFTAGMAAGRMVTLRLVSLDPNDTGTQSALLVIDGVARDMSLQTQIIASLEQMGDMLAAAPAEAQVFTTERIVAQAQSQFERAKTSPLVAVTQKLPKALRQRKEEGFIAGLDLTVTAPGLTVLFAFLTAQTTAQSIYEEKKRGSFRRLLAAPMSKATLLAGKMLPNFLTALIQIVVIFAVGALVFPLLGLGRLTLGNDPLALVLVSMLVALCSTALGVLIAALARTEGQVGGLSTLILWLTGIVGGAVVPLFLLHETLAKIGQVVPQYWAVRAYRDLLVSGLGLADVTIRMAVLLGFGLLFLAVGVWRFDFD